MNSLGPCLIGVTGLELSHMDRLHLKSEQVGGVILFSRNFESRGQLIDLVSDIRRESAGQKLIFVDHEGGRVQRFRDGFTAIPAMRTLGKAVLQDRRKGLLAAQQTGFVLAAELLACGLDMSFAPVLDLDWGNSEIIGNRAFSNNPELVLEIACALIHGLNLAGMQACGKHFPGHGWVKADSHLALPIDERPLDVIRQVDCLPYETLAQLSLAAVMPAHVVYETCDPLPACFSEFWLKEELRGRLGFDGAIISDDLEMVGAHSQGSIEERFDKALEAGCDAVLACNDFEQIQRLVAHPSILTPERQKASQRRLSRLIGKPWLENWSSLKESMVYLNALDAISELTQS